MIFVTTTSLYFLQKGIVLNIPIYEQKQYVPGLSDLANMLSSQTGFSQIKTNPAFEEEVRVAISQLKKEKTKYEPGFMLIKKEISMKSNSEKGVLFDEPERYKWAQGWSEGKTSHVLKELREFSNSISLSNSNTLMKEGVDQLISDLETSLMDDVTLSSLKSSRGSLLSVKIKPDKLLNLLNTKDHAGFIKNSAAMIQFTKEVKETLIGISEESPSSSDSNTLYIGIAPPSPSSTSSDKTSNSQTQTEIIITHQYPLPPQSNRYVTIRFGTKDSKTEGEVERLIKDAEIKLVDNKGGKQLLVKNRGECGSIRYYLI